MSIPPVLTAGILPVLYIIGVATAVLAWFMRRSSKGVRRFRTGFISGVAGGKGNGKTMYAVHELLRHATGPAVFCKSCTYHDPGNPRKKRVRHVPHVASNGNITLPEGFEGRFTHLDSLVDVLYLPHCTLCVIDEAHLWYPLTPGLVMSKVDQWIFSQCRKFEIEFIWLTQDLANVSSGLKRFTDELATCEKTYFRQMHIRYFKPADYEKRGIKPLWKYRYRVSDKLATAYNSYELLMPEDGAPELLALIEHVQARRALHGATPAPAGGTADDVLAVLDAELDSSTT